jgi:hypothetical protein
VTVKAVELLTHPVELFRTVRVPLYMAAEAPAGTVITIGEEDNVALVTLLNVAVRAVASHTMLN